MWQWLCSWYHVIKYKWETRNLVVPVLETDLELKYQEKYKEFLVDEVIDVETNGKGGKIDMNEVFKDL